MEKKSDLILVGNGPSVKSHKMGELIDSYDTVVRFNWYHIDGYEEYVGTKTDIWFTTIFDPIRAKKKYDRVYEHSWCWNPAGDKNYIKLKEFMFTNGSAINLCKTCHKICIDMINYYRRKKRMGTSMVWREEYELWSTGAIAAWWFLNEKKLRYDSDKKTPKCDTIDLYGFDWWDMESNDNHHYGDDQTVGKNHKPKIELEFFKLLHDEGKIYDINPDSDFHYFYE